MHDTRAESSAASGSAHVATLFSACKVQRLPCGAENSGARREANHFSRPSGTTTRGWVHHRPMSARCSQGRKGTPISQHGRVIEEFRGRKSAGAGSVLIGSLELRVPQWRDSQDGTCAHIVEWLRRHDRLQHPGSTQNGNTAHIPWLANLDWKRQVRDLAQEISGHSLRTRKERSHLRRCAGGL